MVYANPIWVAEDVASTRFEESIFKKILLTRRATVLGVTNSSPPISRLLLPAAMRRRTSA